MSVEHSWPVDEAVTFTVERGGAGYWLSDSDSTRVFHATTESVVAHLRHRVRQRLAARMAGTPWLEAGVATLEGKRLVVVGATAEERTRTLIALLLAGTNVEGPAIAYVFRDRVVPLPERFRIGVALARRMPALAAACRTLHPSFEPHGSRLYYLDPANLGRSWRAGDGPPDIVLCLDRTGGRSVLTPMGKVAAVQALLRALRNARGQTGSVIEIISRLANESATYSGDPRRPDRLVAELRVQLRTSPSVEQARLLHADLRRATRGGRLKR